MAGTPPINIFWLRNNVVERNLSDSNSSTYTISDAEDGDNVSCEARSDMGVDMATSTIHVEGDYNSNCNTNSRIDFM